MIVVGEEPESVVSDEVGEKLNSDAAACFALLHDSQTRCSNASLIEAEGSQIFIISNSLLAFHVYL